MTQFIIIEAKGWFQVYHLSIKFANGYLVQIL